MSLAVASARVSQARLRRVVSLGLLLVLLAVVVAASLALGSRTVASGQVLTALVHPVAGDVDHAVVRDLRVPRTVIGLLAGIGFGAAGALMQGVTRNPLADPGLLGVGSGASLAVVAAITWFGVTTPSGYIWFALVGAAAATLLVYGLAGRGAAPSPVTLAITGSATTAVLTSLITVVLLTDAATLQQYRFWSVGSLAGRDLTAAGALWPYLLLGLGLAFGVGRSVDLLAMGDDVATGLGVRAVRARLVAGGAVVLLAGTATALAGPLLLVGLVVPHLVRPLAGLAQRWVLAFSVVGGGILVVAADVVGRLIARPAEVEAGIVAALLGAPVLIALVRRTRLV